MTDEARGDNFEDAPVRPASTRWSEDPVREDEALAPPYVPGRRPATAAPEEDFPFDQFDIEGGLDTDTAEPGIGLGEEATAADTAAATDAGEGTGVAEDVVPESDEMIWSPDDLDDGDEPFDPGERDRGRVSYAEAPYAEESYGEWTPGYEADEGDEGEGEGEGDEDLSAVDAELEPIADESPVEEIEDPEVESPAEGGDGPEYRFEPDGSIEASPAEEGVEEVAAVLDRLAALLRDEGEDAVRREMESPDRLTALVSSVVSGHLSARR